MARVLGVLRLSRASDESTSVVRQRETIERWANSKGHVIVGWVEDVDVSGGIEPWKRPAFGEWLPSTIGKSVSEAEERLAWEASRASEYDILCAWKLDRLSRRVIHISQLAEWCEKHGKQIATVEGDIDLTSPMGRLLFQLIASLAEGELEAIKARAKSSYVHLMKEGRWRGGFVPYGYRPEKQEAGEGWRLVPDDYGLGTAEILRDIVRRTIEGESTNSLCRWLNDKGIPTSLDAQRIRNGQEPKGAKWRVGNLLKMLRSHTLLGHAEMTEEVTGSDGRKVKRTRLVRDADGLPLQRAEPLISQEQWEQLQAKLDESKAPKAANRHDRSPLLRVVFCTCGKPLYRNVGRSRRYYRCAAYTESGKLCPENKSIDAELLEDTIEDAFLRAVGHAEIVRRVFKPGTDYSADIEAVTRALAELREDREAGLYSSEAGKKEYREAYLRMEAKREALLALPSEPDRWEETPTGETYRERWAQLTSSADRNKQLREAGVKAIVHAEELPKALPLAEVGETEGTVRHTLGRVELLLPRNLYDRVRGFAAEHTV